MLDFDMSEYVRLDGGPTLSTLQVWDGREWRSVIVGDLTIVAEKRVEAIRNCLLAACSEALPPHAERMLEAARSFGNGHPPGSLSTPGALFELGRAADRFCGEEGQKEE